MNADLTVVPNGVRRAKSAFKEILARVHDHMGILHFIALATARCDTACENVLGLYWPFVTLPGRFTGKII